MITWSTFLLFDLFLLYLAYEFPYMILWSGMGIFAVTSVVKAPQSKINFVLARMQVRLLPTTPILCDRIIHNFSTIK